MLLMLHRPARTGGEKRIARAAPVIESIEGLELFVERSPRGAIFFGVRGLVAAFGRSNKQRKKAVTSHRTPKILADRPLFFRKIF